MPDVTLVLARFESVSSPRKNCFFAVITTKQFTAGR